MSSDKRFSIFKSSKPNLAGNKEGKSKARIKIRFAKINLSVSLT